RIQQWRTAEEIRQRVRERLLDQDVPSDSDLVRIPPQTMNPLVSGPKIVPIPRTATAEITRSPDELKMTRTAAELNTTSTVALDLPLAEVGVAADFSRPEPATDGGLKPAAPQKPAPAPTPIPTTEVAVEDDDAAEAFVGFETQRIQNVIQASNAMTDEAVRSKVLEACMQRIQLLSNLRSLIQGSGAKSRL